MERMGSIACYSADTSGLIRGGDEPVSLVTVLLQHRTDGTFERVADYEGLQQPINPITCEATAVHGLTNADVEGRSFDLAAIERILDRARAILTWAPRFDRGMFDTMRLRAIDRPWHQMRIVDGSHPLRPTGPSPGISRARARVEHMIDCLTHPDPRQPVRPWLDSVLEMPALEDLPEYQLEGNAAFGEIVHRNIGNSALGARFTLWTKADVDFINAYDRSGPRGGPGLIFKLKKSENRKLAEYMADGGWVEGTLVEIDGMRRRVEIDFPPAPTPPKTPKVCRPRARGPR